MQSDDLIWQLINNNYCSYKHKIETDVFCRSKYNVLGICNKTCCPLANSRYATIIEEDGKCFLYVKTVERAHTPSKLWEVIPLGSEFRQALSIIDQQLVYWPKNTVFIIKKRLIKIWQYLIRIRKLRATSRPELITVNKKIERRELTREAKALASAKIETSIKRELLERLKSNVYGELYNFEPETIDQLVDDDEMEIQELEQYFEDDSVELDIEDFGTTCASNNASSSAEKDSNTFDSAVNSDKHASRSKSNLKQKLALFKNRGRQNVEYETEDTERVSKVVA